jgi:hypothetical protein
MIEKEMKDAKVAVGVLGGGGFDINNPDHLKHAVIYKQ